jgi:hypothetical protein
MKKQIQYGLQEKCQMVAEQGEGFIAFLTNT